MCIPKQKTMAKQNSWKQQIIDENMNQEIVGNQIKIEITA